MTHFGYFMRTLFELLKESFQRNYVIQEVHLSPAYKAISILQ